MIEDLIVAKLVGPVDHPDFHEAAAILRGTARCETGGHAAPEVVIVAQARPGQVGQAEIESIQRQWPLASILAILGSCCEGETRTGKPWPGVKRFFWYEFPAWWRQQIALRSARLCPDWARTTLDVYRTPQIGSSQEVYPPRREIRNRPQGLIRLGTRIRDTADVLADVLHEAGYSVVWNPHDHANVLMRGAVAGVWDGAQLDEGEIIELAAFCRSQACEPIPVVALLDFPRRDRCEIAQQLGVAAVLGKPWINADLVATIDGFASGDSLWSRNQRAA
jgi:hypothetical protein